MAFSLLPISVYFNFLCLHKAYYLYRETKAHILFEAGKNCEGYFTNVNLLAQTSLAMDILMKHYPNEDDVFIFDNATTHTKCAANALSVASKKPTQTQKPSC